MSPRLELEAAMDDVSDYAIKHQQARYAPIGTSIPDPRPPVRYVPRAALMFSPARASTREEFVRLSINDKDVAEALEWMFVHGELSEELSERIDEKAAEFCEKRLEEEGRAA